MKIQKLKNGKIKISVQLPRWERRPNKYDPYGIENRVPDMPLLAVPGKSQWDENYREPQVGDEICLGIVDDESVFFCTNPDGIAGNSDHNIRRLHGWRGTTNNRSTSAHGWRRVEEIRDAPQGLGWVILLSEDLKPDAE